MDLSSSQSPRTVTTCKQPGACSMPVLTLCARCPASLRSMFRSAEHPEKLTVAIIQQNCEEECETGTGWANTRRLVPSDPDPHCAREFCESEFGKPHCEAGRVRVLRMQEYEVALPSLWLSVALLLSRCDSVADQRGAQAWGPFFARFLASKVWNGQNYILQIDAHTQFRENWDSAFIHMIKKTPSYPKSVRSIRPLSLPQSELVGHRCCRPTLTLSEVASASAQHHFVGSRSRDTVLARLSGFSRAFLRRDTVRALPS